MAYQIEAEGHQEVSLDVVLQQAGGKKFPNRPNHQNS
jgi:hypothetical protein